MKNLTNIPDCEYYPMLAASIKKEIDYHIGVAREYKEIDKHITEIHINEAERGVKRLEEIYAACRK